MTTLRMDQELTEFIIKSQLDEIVEKSLKSAAIWDELKDRLKEERSWTFRRTAAASLYRKSSGGRTGSSV